MIGNPQDNFRPGLALLLVMVCVGAAVAVATFLVSLSAVHVLSSADTINYAKAGNLAESGLSEAAYFLANPPSDLSGDYWTGVSNRQLDGSGSYYDVVVTRDTDNTVLYHAVSTGHLVGPAGEIMSLSMQRTFHIEKSTRFSHDLIADHYLYVPSQVIVNGNTHAAGNFTNLGTIRGNAEATGSIVNRGIITGEINPNASEIDIPQCQIDSPVTYSYEGTEYRATAISASLLENTDWSVPPEDNPMGVYVRNGNLTLGSGNTIVGTLIVTGRLTMAMEAGESTITANPGFPGVVAQGNVILQLNGAVVTVNGALITRGTISANKTQDSKMITNGPVIFLNPIKQIVSIVEATIALKAISKDNSESSKSEAIISPVPEPIPILRGGFARFLTGVTFTINHTESRMDVSGLFP